MCVVCARGGEPGKREDVGFCCMHACETIRAALSPSAAFLPMCADECRPTVGL